MNICLFNRAELSCPLSIHDERGEHIVKVLHKKTGDTFSAGIIGGPSGAATITAIDSDGLHFTFTATGDGKPLLPLVLVVGFPRPIQLRRLLRDAASLGVQEVHLTGTELGDKSYMKSTMLQSGAANRALLEGAAQAGSTHAPKLFMHQTLEECLDAFHNHGSMVSMVSMVSIRSATQPSTYTTQPPTRLDGAALTNHSMEVKIALDNVRPAMTLIDYLCQIHSHFSSSSRCIAAIGAERGFSDAERDVFTDGGWTLCSMGERILRTETAVTAASSIILATFLKNKADKTQPHGKQTEMPFCCPLDISAH